ncbi:MAG: CBS domain-containing protein [Candidatus Nanoarchaeia archaeon]
MASGIKAIDIMTGEVVIARADMTIAEAARLMNIFRIGGLPVVEQGKLVGMLTERDIMRGVVAANKRPADVLVADIMTSPPKVTATIDEDLSVLAEKIAKFDVTRIPIVDKEGHVVGIVTNRDVVMNSKEYLEILLEQAKVKGRLSEDYAAYGKCELCQQASHLFFKKNRFVCDNCSKLKI